MLTGSITERVDLRGKTITTFIAFELHQALESLEVGDRITDVTHAVPAIETDMRSWTRIRGHRLVSFEHIGDRFTFEVEKGTPTTPARAVAVVISTEDMLALLSPLAFALVAALEGHQVSLYLQGPGIRVLGSGYRPRLSGWSRPLIRFGRKGIEASGHVDGPLRGGPGPAGIPRHHRRGVPDHCRCDGQRRRPVLRVVGQSAQPVSAHRSPRPCGPLVGPG